MEQEDKPKVTATPTMSKPPASEMDAALDTSSPTVSQAVVATSLAVSAGLAAIAEARTVTEVYAATCAFAARLPGVEAVAILRRDEDGLLKTGYQPAVGRLPHRILDLAGAALHQRWIAAHAPDAPAHGLGPFEVEDHSDLLVIPFARDDALLGALVIACREQRPAAATKAERITAAAIGVVAAQALNSVILRQRLDLAISRSEHEAKLAEELKQISHKLHDGPTQELALAGITIDRLIGDLSANEQAVLDAELARDMIDRAIHGMRGILSTIRTPDPKTPSVTGPLRELLAQIEQEQVPNSPELEVDISQVSGVQLAPEFERALIGIVREALHNVRKHAHAESVQLDIRRVDEGVEIGIVDDGVGFDGMGQAGHFGLEQIRELAEGTGGRVEIGSLPGIGTSIRAWIPLPSHAGEADLSLRWANGIESSLEWADNARSDRPPNASS